MREILQTDRRRRLELIELLYTYHGKWVTFKELAAKMDYSERVLKKDIAELKNSSSDFSLETSRSGIRLLFSPNSGIEKIYQSILKESFAFQFIEYLLYDETKSVEEMAELLFVSPSTLYRMIRKMNHSLKVFSVQISVSPCMIKGSEKDIRYFYSHYFLERYSYLDWPFRTIELENFEEFILFFITFTEVTISFPSFVRLKYMTAINLIRTRSQHYVKNNGPTNFSEIIPDMAQYKSLFEPIEKNLQIPVNDYTIEQLFMNFVRNDFSISYSRLLEKVEKDSFTRRSFELLSVLVDELASTFRIPLTNREELLLALCNASSVIDKKPAAPDYILFNKKKHFFDYLNNDHFSFMVFAEQSLSNYLEKIEKGHHDVMKHELLYLLITHWNNLIQELFKNQKIVSLLIISNYGTEHSKMLKDIMELHFKDLVSVNVYTEPQLSIEKLQSSRYDILIANFSLDPIQKKDVLCIEDIPTKRDLSHIRETVERHQKNSILETFDSTNSSLPAN